MSEGVELEVSKLSTDRGVPFGSQSPVFFSNPLFLFEPFWDCRGSCEARHQEDDKKHFSLCCCQKKFSGQRTRRERETTKITVSYCGKCPSPPFYNILSHEKRRGEYIWGTEGCSGTRALNNPSLFHGGGGGWCTQKSLRQHPLTIHLSSSLRCPLITHKTLLESILTHCVFP